MQIQSSYKVHLNKISNGVLSDPLCDSVNRGLTLVRVGAGYLTCNSHLPAYMYFWLNTDIKQMFLTFKNISMKCTSIHVIHVSKCWIIDERFVLLITGNHENGTYLILKCSICHVNCHWNTKTTKKKQKRTTNRRPLGHISHLSTSSSYHYLIILKRWGGGSKEIAAFEKTKNNLRGNGTPPNNYVLYFLSK